jgi:glycerol-3-phosphate dehydrogenase (NAD(P)+)
MRRAGRDVILWAREPEVVESINARHVNETFLPGVALDGKIRATGKLGDVAGCDALLLVAPAQHVRSVARELRPSLRDMQPIVMCAKGIEQSSGQMMGDVLGAELPAVTQAVLSGPSFAADVARGLPAALTVACADEVIGRALAERLGGPGFRLYWTNDVVGVELGGALKNVLAIAAGIVDGKGLGASAHAALVTRGFAEMRRLGSALGARPETLIGLSGLGDLILTCGSPQSRNMSLGRALGRGQTLDQALAGKVSVSEGVYTATAVRRIAQEKGIEMPICAAVCDVVEGRASVDAAIGQLMNRPIKAED